MRTKLAIIQKAQQEWIEFKYNQLPSHQIEKRIHVDRQQNWKAPAADTIKLNVSSVCDKNYSSVRVGIIARDAAKQRVQAWSVARDSTINPVVAEVDAVRIALLLVHKNDWKQVEIQLDIKALVECL